MKQDDYMVRIKRNTRLTTIGILLMSAWKEGGGALLINSPVTQNCSLTFK